MNLLLTSIVLFGSFLCFALGMYMSGKNSKYYGTGLYSVLMWCALFAAFAVGNFTGWLAAIIAMND